MTFRDDNDALRARLEEAESKIRHYEQSIASGEDRKTIHKLEAERDTLRTQRDNAEAAYAATARNAASLSEDLRKRPHPHLLYAAIVLSAVLAVAVHSLVEAVIGTAHDIQTCSECPQPECPQAPVTELGVQCQHVCSTLGMQQIAHYDHGAYYSCTCALEGRMCAFVSPHNGSITSAGTLDCTNASGSP